MSSPSVTHHHNNYILLHHTTTPYLLNYHTTPIPMKFSGFKYFGTPFCPITTENKLSSVFFFFSVLSFSFIGPGNSSRATPVATNWRRKLAVCTLLQSGKGSVFHHQHQDLWVSRAEEAVCLVSQNSAVQGDLSGSAKCGLFDTSNSVGPLVD